MPTERMIIGPQRVYRDLHELLVKLTVLQFDLNRDVIRKVLGKLERIMNNVGSPRRNLVVIQRSTYILSVTSIYPLALLVQHKHIQKVCPAVHFNGIPPIPKLSAMHRRKTDEPPGDTNARRVRMTQQTTIHRERQSRGGYNANGRLTSRVRKSGLNTTPKTGRVKASTVREPATFGQRSH